MPPVNITTQLVSHHLSSYFRDRSVFTRQSLNTTIFGFDPNQMSSLAVIYNKMKKKDFDGEKYSSRCDKRLCKS